MAHATTEVPDIKTTADKSVASQTSSQLTSAPHYKNTFAHHIKPGFRHQGMYPKNTGGFFWVHPPKTTHPPKKKHTHTLLF